MDFCRIKDRADPLSAVAFVREFRAQLEPLRFQVSRLPEQYQPHCTMCDEPTHIYDHKRLLAGETRQTNKSRKILARPGLHHYKSIPWCAYSYSHDPHIGDFVSRSVFNKAEISFNEHALSDASVIRGTDLAIDYFMRAYAGPAGANDGDRARLARLSRTFVLPFGGVGSAPWLKIFILMMVLPDREIVHADGTKSVVGFRRGYHSQRLVLATSSGETKSVSFPQQIYLGHISAKAVKKRSIPVVENEGHLQLFDVSRESALDLFRREKALRRSTAPAASPLQEDSAMQAELSLNALMRREAERIDRNAPEKSHERSPHRRRTRRRFDTRQPDLLLELVPAGG